MNPLVESLLGFKAIVLIDGTVMLDNNLTRILSVEHSRPDFDPQF
jgi:hypothetical protein